MTHPSKIDFIRQACIKANPSILNLEFGCEIEIEKFGVGKYLGTTNDFPTGWFSLNQEIYPLIGHKYKILGRPIRLADVLVAIGKDAEKSTDFDLYSDRLNIGHYDEVGYYTHCRWNLLSDDLTKQSQECVEFIYNLLK